MDKMRAEFEAWVVGCRFFKKLKAHLKQNADGSYGCYAVNDRWVAWQAARQPERGEAVAWMTEDGERCVTERTMAGARKDGGAMLSSLSAYVVPLTYAHPPAADARVALSVWYGAMPESNGKSNWTAVLVRDGDIVSGYTFARSEYEDRVRYEADSMRFIIGEIDERPDLMAYDPDKHSGYIYPQSAEAARIAALESQLAASREREGRMREVIAMTVKDLKMRADMKMDKSQRGVVDVGNSVWFALNEALAAEKGEK